MRHGAAVRGVLALTAEQAESEEAGDVSRIEPLSESVVCPPRFISALGSGWLAAAGGNVPKLR